MEFHDSVPVWEDHGNDEKRTRSVRPMSAADWRGEWEAYNIINKCAFDILYADDFRTNLCKLEAFVMLWNANRHIMRQEHIFIQGGKG